MNKTHFQIAFVLSLCAKVIFAFDCQPMTLHSLAWESDFIVKARVVGVDSNQVTIESINQIKGDSSSKFTVLNKKRRPILSDHYTRIGPLSEIVPLGDTALFFLSQANEKSGYIMGCYNEGLAPISGRAAFLSRSLTRLDSAALKATKVSYKGKVMWAYELDGECVIRNLKFVLGLEGKSRIKNLKAAYESAKEPCDKAIIGEFFYYPNFREE